MRRRTFFALGLLVSLLVAGVLSYYASAHPDGLEHVAGQLGFHDTARDSAASGSPLAGYGVKGVGSERVSVGLSGVIGALVVLALTTGLFWVLRRRSR